jgi:hypothetical protein
MSRGRLLLVAERAIEIVPVAQLAALVGDMVRIPMLAEGEGGAGSLLDEVQKFHDASLRRDYYESFDVNSKNCTQHSRGTDAFIAEFDRLIGRCLHASAESPRKSAREAFEILFALLRCLDEDPDSILFFADEGGAWQIPVDWEAVLPAYFTCLAEGASSDEFAREVDRAIKDFCPYRRSPLLLAAQSMANSEQQLALAARAGL